MASGRCGGRSSASRPGPASDAARPCSQAPAQAASPQLALTIVIPVYNGATSIGELVAALEALTIDGGHEIVLVNDGSPDDMAFSQCGLPSTNANGRTKISSPASSLTCRAH